MDELVLILPRAVCAVCGKDGKAVYHSRHSRGPLACEECWEEIHKQQEQERENDESKGTER